MAARSGSPSFPWCLFMGPRGPEGTLVQSVECAKNPHSTD